MHKINTAALLLIVILFITWSCGNSAYESKVDFKNGYWLWKEPVSFSFSIDDASKKYDLSFFIRNSIDYEYQNLYIQYYLENSNGYVMTEKLHNVIVFDPKTGKPVGNGMGDIYDIERTFLSGFSFDSAGEYKLRLDQFMRKDTLHNIQAIGLKISETAAMD